jgi:hypothetical protein
VETLTEKAGVAVVALDVEGALVTGGGVVVDELTVGDVVVEIEAVMADVAGAPRREAPPHLAATSRRPASAARRDATARRR